MAPASLAMKAYASRGSRLSAFLAVFCFLVGLLPLSAGATTLVLKRGVNFEAWQKWTKKTDFLAGWYDRSNFPDWSKSVSDESLAAIKAQGFDFVRLNVDPSPFLWKADLATGLAQNVVAATERLRRAGLKVLVDVHALPEADDRPDGVHTILGTGGVAEQDFSRFLSVVELLAARLSHLPASEVGLEVINEPDQDWFSPTPAGDRWPGQVHALYEAARRAAPDMTLVLTGSRSGSIEGLLRLDPKPFAGDANVLWSFHFYEPMIVTHAGLPWERNAHHFLERVPYPAALVDGRQRDYLLRRAKDRVASEIGDPGLRAGLSRDIERTLDAYAASGEGPATIARRFDEVVKWAAANKIATSRILLGEFGAYQDAIDPDTHAGILRATRRAAEERGFGWAVYTAGLTAGPQSFGIMRSPNGVEIDWQVATALGLREPRRADERPAHH